MSLTVEASVRDIAHGVLDRPNDTVHEKLELCRGDGEKGYIHLSMSIRRSIQENVQAAYRGSNSS